MTNLTRNILFQYFSGAASPLQKEMIKEWLEAEANKDLFYEWLEEWEKENIQFLPDVNSALIRIRHKINTQTSPVSAIKTGISKRSALNINKRWWAAASILFMLGVSLFISQDKIIYQQYDTTYEEVKEFTLPDGSNVVLNANSSLQVPRWGFKTGARKVKLDGEAAFSVIHTKNNKKFLVSTGKRFTVEVLGTEFSVYSRKDLNKVELRKGSVKLLFSKREGSKSFMMKPGDIARINKGGELTVKHHQQPTNFISWKQHRFIFNNTPLDEVVSSIKNFFGVNIIIGDSVLNGKHITGSFKAESSGELLKVLAEIYDLELVNGPDVIILRMRKQEQTLNNF